MSDILIKNLSDYQRHIASIQNNLETFIYRGQANENWKVASGVYRRISESKKKANLPEAEVQKEEVREYLNERLIEAKKRLSPFQISELREINDINVLVEMQHYGGATNLIDFSFNSLIALYFASLDHNEVNGKVFCINNSNPYKVMAANQKSLEELVKTQVGTFYSYSPNHSNRRIVKQDSIFIFNNIGFIDDALIDFTFTISADSKKTIIQELKEIAGITEESIYPDFLGYLQANSSSKPFKIKNAQDYFEQAVRLHKKKEYAQAIDYYLKSLNIDAQQANAYLGITQCYRRLKKYKEALENAMQARKIDGKSFTIHNEVAVLNAFLRNYRESKDAFQAAEQFISNSDQRRIFNNNLSWTYLCFGEIKMAKELLETFIERETSHHHLINLGHCYLLAKDEKTALDFYTKSLKCAPSPQDFLDSFEYDYKFIEMEKLGISKEYYNALKAKLIPAI